MRRVRSLAQNWHPVAGVERGKPFPRLQVRVHVVCVRPCAREAQHQVYAVPPLLGSLAPSRLPVGVTIVVASSYQRQRCNAAVSLG